VVFSLVFLIVMAGCAGTTTFTAYPKKINPYIASMQNRTPIDLNQCLTSEAGSKDLILYNMERGRIAQVTGFLDYSLRDFNISIDQIKQNEEKARIRASSAGATIAATLLNDNAIPYESDGYERVMVHHYQALNFLKKKDIEGAGVEARRANSEQADALKRFERDVEKAQKEAEDKNVGSRGNSASVIGQQYAQMDEVAGKVKNSFQNAYTFYLSGIIYELNKQPNDAYIDYKKALEIFPENSYLQKDVMRLAAALDMREDVDALKERFKIEPPTASAADDSKGELLVLFEEGFVPQKQEIKIPLPVPRVGLLAIAFPIYKERWTPKNSLSIIKDGGRVGTTEPICDFRALAVMALKEKVPAITTRQIIRAASKGAATYAAKEQLGLAGQLAMSVYNYSSESADLRSWITLPSNAQILRTDMESGIHKLALASAGILEPVSVDVEIPAGGKTILHVVRAGNQFYISTTSFIMKTPAAQP
jgi:hypothetical protein